jgi:hypothetical protein
MKGPRYSIAGLMGIVMVAVVGLAALRNPSETWAGAMLLLTCGILALGVVGAIDRRGARRAWWLGFSVFGWGYIALSGSWSASNLVGQSSTKLFDKLPTTTVLELLASRLEVPRPYSCFIPRDALNPYYARMGHCLWALLAALLGGLLSILSFRPSGDPADRSRPDARETTGQPRSRWSLPTILGLVTLILGNAAATIRSGSEAPLWAGITFALTCALVGLAILGAVAGRGHRRAMSLGAALFGAGYLLLVSLHSPNNSPLMHPIWIAFRSRILAPAKGAGPGNASIVEVLRRPIPMRFPDETPLEDWLDYIRRSTWTASGPGIPIYVDPVGLREAERHLSSTVQIDLEGVPLKETLRLGLKQLGLVYAVEDGCLRITGADSAATEPDDPLLIVGHCLLALMAAGFGAVAAPMVAGERREPPGEGSGPAGYSRPA